MAACGQRVRQVAAGAWQSDVARTQGISPALLGRSGNARHWKQPHPDSAERDGIRQQRAALKRVKMERDILNKLRPLKYSSRSTSNISFRNYYAFIEAYPKQWPVQLSCQMLEQFSG